MADVLLIYPKTDTDVIQAPLSFMYIAKALQSHTPNSVKIIDTRVNKNYEEDILKILKQGVICCGLTTMTGGQIKHSIEISKFIKENSDAPVVWGGVHPSIDPITTVKNKYIDFVVKGDGEETFIELLNSLENKKPIEDVTGIFYKKKGKIHANPPRPFIDVNKFPIPAWDILDDISPYLQNVPVNNSLAMYSSRGCPHNCTFCFNARYTNRTWRGRDPSNVIEEANLLKEKYNIEGINFCDDNFCTNKKRVIEICKGLKKLDLKWSCSIRAEYFDKKLIKIMASSGCVSLFIGAESGSQKILDKLCKGIKVENLINSANICKETNIKPIYSFLVGHPDETIDDVNKTIDVINKIKEIKPNAVIQSLRLITPYAGTEMFETAVKYGLKPPTTLEEWAEFTWRNNNVPWIKNPEFYETLNNASLFAFDDYLKKSIRKPHLKIAFELLRKISYFRWKYKFWKFPVEVKMVRRYKEKKIKNTFKILI